MWSFSQGKARQKGLRAMESVWAQTERSSGLEGGGGPTARAAPGLADQVRDSGICYKRRGPPLKSFSRSE